MLLVRAVGVVVPLPPLLRAASRGCGGSACRGLCPGALVGVLLPDADGVPAEDGVRAPPLPLSAWPCLGSSSVPAVPAGTDPGLGGSRLISGTRHVAPTKHELFVGVD